MTDNKELVETIRTTATVALSTYAIKSGIGILQLGRLNNSISLLVKQNHSDMHFLTKNVSETSFQIANRLGDIILSLGHIGALLEQGLMTGRTGHVDDIESAYRKGPMHARNYRQQMGYIGDTSTLHSGYSDFMYYKGEHML